MSLTLNQKLDMIVLSEEGMSEAKIGGTWPLVPVSQVVNAKKKFLKGIKSANSSEHMNDKKVKQPYCRYGESLVV